MLSSTMSFDDWYSIHEDTLFKIYSKVFNTIQYETDLYYPITSMVINEDMLFEKITQYLYKTSNNKFKRFVHSNNA